MADYYIPTIVFLSSTAFSFCFPIFITITCVRNIAHELEHLADGELSFFHLVQHIRICEVGEKGFDENRIKILTNEVCIGLKPPEVGK